MLAGKTVPKPLKKHEGNFSPKRQPSQQRAEKTKARIIDAAVRVLGELGIDAFSIRQVASVAGTSVGSVYEYFPSKQALLFYVAEQRLGQRLVIFDSVLTDENLGKSLHQLINLYLYALRDAGMYSRLDLEIRVAEERDSQLAQYTARYKRELTDRYIHIWQHYGATLGEKELNLIAQYAHQLDLASMKLQLEMPDEDQASVRHITEQLVHVLVDLGLQKSTSVKSQ